MERPTEPKFSQIVWFLPRLLFTICYSVGWLLLSAVNFLWPHHSRRFAWRQKLNNARQLRLGHTLATFMVLAAVVLGSFQVANLVASGQKLKGQVMGDADQGLSHLSEAQSLLQQQDLNGVSSRLGLALQSFEKSRSDLNSNNLLLQGLLNLVPQKQDADQLLQASILLTQAGQDWAHFYQLDQNLKITPQGISGTDNPGLALQQMNEALQTGRAKITQALHLIDEVNPNIIPDDKQGTFLQVKGNIAAIQTAIDTVGQVFEILYAIIAGQKNILFLFENYNEMRATGGFMGTFGAMKMQDGQINSLHISSIYDLDGQLQENFAVPRPMRAVNSQWYLRDTNWFSDFRQSAKVITRFYEKEGGETPDIIIALTPQLVVDLLKVSGPVHLSRYNVTFTAENFVELAQTESSINYDRTLNQPKQVLADFFPAFLQQLSDAEASTLLPVMAALQKNLLNKQMLIYARDPNLQMKLERFNWAGSVKGTDRDYVLVSTSNLGGTKTDTFIKQEIKLDSVINSNGKITNTLSITRTNPLADRYELRNRSFMRIYVPPNSRLLSAQGFTPFDIPAADTSNQKVDPDVAVWEQASVMDTVSGTLIGQESGKTIFGNWLDLNGGESKTVTLTYELPFTLHDLDHHSLLVQKQAGTLNQSLSYSLKFADYSIVWKNFQAQQLNNHDLTVNAVLDKDTFFGLILQQP